MCENGFLLTIISLDLRDRNQAITTHFRSTFQSSLENFHSLIKSASKIRSLTIYDKNRDNLSPIHNCCKDFVYIHPAHLVLHTHI